MNNPIKLFIKSAGGVLLASAMVRFVIALGDAPVLAMPEPAIGMPLRYAVLLIGGVEMLVALICLFGKRDRLQLSWLAWLATNLITFRVGLFWMHIHPQTASIGSLTDPLRLAHGTTGMIIEWWPAYIALGSYSGLFWLCLAEPVLLRRQRERIESLKMSCPACGIHIRFAGNNLGQKIPCPQCRTMITLRKPDLLKMSCFFCQEHIEFPPHAIGEKIPCPHCKMDITLKEPA